MLRDQILASIINISNAILASDAHEILGHALRTPPEARTRFAAHYIESFRRYANFSASFSSTERFVLETMDLGFLDRPDFWAGLFTPDTDHDYDVEESYNAVRFAVAFLPKLGTLLKSSGSLENFKKEKGLDDNNYLSMVRIILPESEKQLSRPQRIVETISAIEEIYEVCCQFTGDNSNEIYVSALDSGSDKSIDIVGAAKAIECLKDIILSMWDRIVFYRERKEAERIRLVSESLPVLEKISEMETAGAISGETANYLKHKVTHGSQRLLNSGAIIPEISENSSYDPKTLMAPQPKLISYTASENEGSDVGSRSESNKESHPTNSEAGGDSFSEMIDSLSPEQKNLLKKALSQGTKKSKR